MIETEWCINCEKLRSQFKSLDIIMARMSKDLHSRQYEVKECYRRLTILCSFATSLVGLGVGMWLGVFL